MLKLQQSNLRLQVELEKLAIEKEKLELERKKVKNPEDDENKKISESNYINDFLNAIKPGSPVLESEPKPEGENVIPS